MPRATKRPLRVKGLELLLPLNRGGMGEVWLGRRMGAHGFERLVAVKMIRGELATHQNVRDMFLDEAAVLSRVTHPAVAQAQDFGESAGNMYLVLEYVPGLSLSRMMKRRGAALPAGIAARMVAEIARGLHAVHVQQDPGGEPLGIVHRDISPQNIMLSFDGRMKLLDFGIALRADRRSEATTSGWVKGKISYVSPEQITAAAADRRSDVYSLCVVLHELLTGKALFETRTSALAAAEDRRRPPRPSRSKKVPAALDRIVMRGLQLEPQRRWPNARELAIALEGFAAKSGAPTLEAFAEDEMTNDRVAHRSWLASLAGTEVDGLGPPPTELAEEIEVGASVLADLEPERAEDASSASDEASPGGTGRPRRGWLSAAAVLVTALLVGGFMAVAAGAWAIERPRGLPFTMPPALEVLFERLWSSVPPAAPDEASSTAVEEGPKKVSPSFAAAARAAAVAGAGRSGKVSKAIASAEAPGIRRARRRAARRPARSAASGPTTGAPASSRTAPSPTRPRSGPNRARKEERPRARRRSGDNEKRPTGPRAGTQAGTARKSPERRK